MVESQINTKHKEVLLGKLEPELLEASHFCLTVHLFGGTEMLSMEKKKLPSKS